MVGDESERMAPVQAGGNASRAGAGLAAGLVAVAVAYFLWNALYYFPFTVDDAFISIRYAQNLIDGQGLVYNGGERVEGFSNFSWVMLASLVLAAGLPVVSTLKWVGVAAGALTLVLTYRLGRRLLGREERAASLLAVWLLALNTGFAMWAQAGLETVFLALLLVATSLRFETELARERALPISAVLFALAWMTRPEVPLYGLYILWRRFGLRHARPWSRADLWWGGTAAAFIVPYEIWGFLYYGNLLANTHVAKTRDATSWRALQQLVDQPLLRRFVGVQGWGFVGLLGLGLGGGLATRLRGATLPMALWLIPACGLVFVGYARIDWMPRHRFLTPVLPFLFLLLATGLCRLVALVRRKPVLWVCGLALVGVLLLDYARVQMFWGDGPPTRKNKRQTYLPVRFRDFWLDDVPEQLRSPPFPRSVAHLSWFMLANVPDGEVLVLRDIGLVGYLTMNPVWDTAGLVTPTAARQRHEHTKEARRAMFEELRALRPAAIWLEFLKRRNGPDFPVYRSLERDTALLEQYRRVSPLGPVTDETRRVVYLRSDLLSPKLEERLVPALRRVPEFRGWAEQLVARPPEGMPSD